MANTVCVSRRTPLSALSRAIMVKVGGDGGVIRRWLESSWWESQSALYFTPDLKLAAAILLPQALPASDDHQFSGERWGREVAESLFSVLTPQKVGMRYHFAPFAEQTDIMLNWGRNFAKLKHMPDSASCVAAIKLQTCNVVVVWQCSKNPEVRDDFKIYK